MRTIRVVDYDPGWVETFERLQARIWPAVRDVAVAVEQIGSTAVPGLAAKPIVDISVVVADRRDVPKAVERLAALGYVHRGDLGIEGREAFSNPPGLPDHHLYVCSRDAAALANHLALRDHLRAHPETARCYGELKKRLAAEFPHDIDAYIEGKTELILGVLRAAGFPEEQLAAMAEANRKRS